MSQQFTQLLLCFSDFMRQAKFVTWTIDISEMQRRIAHALRSLSTQCTPSSGPLVSVVVPTRNEADILPKLLYSIKNQCYRDIEVVVADYTSTDGTPQIAKLLGARVLNLEKPGVGYATYLAVYECKGEIIVRTDADTIFPKTSYLPPWQCCGIEANS